MIEVLGWAGTLLALACYAISVKRERPEVFHAGNVVASGLLGFYNAVAGVWPTVALNLFFGAVGAVGLWKWWRGRQTASLCS